MLDMDYYNDKFGKAELIRFFRWCFTNKEAARKLFDLKSGMKETEERNIIQSLEQEGLYTASIMYQLLKIDCNDIVDIILDTDIELLNNIEDDYLPIGVSDYLSFIKSEPGKSAEEFRVFWTNYFKDNSNPGEYENRTLIQWLANEWYEWEYICHMHCPRPEVIEALYRKISILAINDSGFLAVLAFMQEKFYDFKDEEWILKPYILAGEDIDRIYCDKCNNSDRPAHLLRRP